MKYFCSGLFFRARAAFLNVDCGRNIKVWGPVDIMKSTGTRISIGDNVLIVSDSRRATASALYGNVRLHTLMKGAGIIIGKGVGLNGTSITARSKTVKISDGTMIAPNVIIVDSDFHAPWPPEERLTNPGMENDADVIVGKNVWIGMNTIILKGTTIGDNSIIGAGSVIRGEVPADCLFAGNPARFIKKIGG